MGDCPACGRPGMRRALRVTPSRHLGLEGVVCDVLRCTGCGYRTVHPLPDEETLAKVYGGSFHDTAQQTAPLAPDGTLAPEARRRPVYRNAVRRVRLLRRLRPEGRLLDIGCGKGFFVHAASEHYGAAGIDLSADAVAWGRALGLDLVCGDFRDHDFGEQRFDVITLWDVLACFADQREVLTRVGDLLAPGGVVAVTVPDAGSLACRLMGRHWPLMIPPINLAFHTRRSLKAMIGQCGLRLAHFTHPGKWVAAGFLWLKLKRMLRRGERNESTRASQCGLSVYVNLRDIATAILEKV